MANGNKEIMRTTSYVHVVLALLAAVTCLSFMSSGAFAADEKSLSEKLVDSFNALSGGPHAGYRANHAKGVLASGTFTPTDASSRLASHSSIIISVDSCRIRGVAGNPEKGATIRLQAYARNR